MKSKTFFKITTDPITYTSQTQKCITHIIYDHDTLYTNNSSLILNSDIISTSSLKHAQYPDATPINYILEANKAYKLSSSSKPFFLFICDNNFVKDCSISLNVRNNFFAPSYDIIVEEMKVSGKCGKISLECDKNAVILGNIDESKSLKIKLMLYKSNKYRFVMDSVSDVLIKGYTNKQDDCDTDLIYANMNKIYKNSKTNITNNENTNKVRKPENKASTKIPKKGIIKDKIEIKRKKTVTFNLDNTKKKHNTLKYNIKTKGNGRVIQYGDTVKIKYRGMLEGGKIFDESKKNPFSFIFGKGQVIKGLEMGMEGMAVGEKRVIRIPSILGYGSYEDEKIPANSNLIFDVELLDQIKKQRKERQENETFLARVYELEEDLLKTIYPKEEDRALWRQKCLREYAEKKDLYLANLKSKQNDEPKKEMQDKEKREKIFK